MLRSVCIRNTKKSTRLVENFYHNGKAGYPGDCLERKNVIMESNALRGKACLDPIMTHESSLAKRRFGRKLTSHCRRVLGGKV